MFFERRVDLFQVRAGDADAAGGPGGLRQGGLQDAACERHQRQRGGLLGLLGHGAGEQQQGQVAQHAQDSCNTGES